MSIMSSLTVFGCRATIIFRIKNGVPRVCKLLNQSVRDEHETLTSEGTDFREN